jgi:hypothetical protein
MLDSAQHDVVEDAGRRSWAKRGTEASGRRAEGHPTAVVSASEDAPPFPPRSSSCFNPGPPLREERLEARLRIQVNRAEQAA